MGLIFNEPNCDTFIVKGESMIYFLLNNNRVVYVGQTKQGILRPLSHKDKVFDTIKILYCDQKDLGVLEDKFIVKYRPKYNRTISLAANYSMPKARNIIRQEINNSYFSVTHLKNIMKQLDIQGITFDFKVYIKQEDFERVMEYVRKTKDKWASLRSW